MVVALHTEGVDRNMWLLFTLAGVRGVALHTEGVDRNVFIVRQDACVEKVALHTEGVDRNDQDGQMKLGHDAVALHTEGVDRNTLPETWESNYFLSPSTRRAWIEIITDSWAAASPFVALHTEGVDRNNPGGFATSPLNCRPPHGGRG